MPLVAAEVDVRGAEWRSEKLRCPCFKDKRQKTSEAPIYSTVHLLHREKDAISSVFQSVEVCGSPADVPVALPVLAAGCFADAPVLEERVFEGVSQGQPLGGLILQHAFNEVKQLVVLLCF